MLSHKIHTLFKHFSNARYATVIAIGAMSLLINGCDNKKKSTQKADIPEYKIAILDHACDPMNMEINAGRVRFLIENKSNRTVEWEILKGVRIIAERENIPPSFTQKLTVTLDPDNYEMTCGLLSNPRGTLVVNPTEEANYQRKPTPIELVNVAGEYTVYVITEVNKLLNQTKQLDEAIKNGNLVQAQSLYITSLQHYEHIEPVMKSFGDLDNAIAADETVFKDKHLDPQFQGFHKVEWALFGQQSTQGLEQTMSKLLENIIQLQTQMDSFTVQPENIVMYAQSLIDEITDNKLSGNKSLYAHSELSSIQANLDGFNRLYRLLSPLIQKGDPAIFDKINAQINNLTEVLDKNKMNANFISYQQVSDNDKALLKEHALQLAELFSSVPVILGIE